MSPLKKVILFCHRWLGFLSGIVVFIVSITGCIFCFQDEIQDAIYSHRHVVAQARPYTPPSKLINVLKANYPTATTDYIYYYGKDRPAGIYTNLGEKTAAYFVYMNPYTGQILHKENTATNFFTVVEFIHLYLLLPPTIGSWVVGISVIIFVVLMITGIILWWPKRKSDRKRSFAVKWGGRWRRVNYDLHNVLGFYATSVALILAISGLAIAFQPVSKAIYNTANLGSVDYDTEVTEPKSDSLKRTGLAAKPVIDIALAYAMQYSPKAQMFLIHNDPALSGAIGVGAYAKTMHYSHADGFEFDKYNGKLLKTYNYNKKSAGLKLNEMNYDIHVGQIFGLPSKIIAFLASLICASLPITGFIIWLGKRKKPKSKKVRTVVHRKTHKRQVLVAGE